MSRDTFKLKLHHKSKVENFADVMESLYRSMQRCGVKPEEVIKLMEKREYDLQLKTLQQQQQTGDSIC